MTTRDQLVEEGRAQGLREAAAECEREAVAWLASAGATNALKVVANNLRALAASPRRETEVCGTCVICGGPSSDPDYTCGKCPTPTAEELEQLREEVHQEGSLLCCDLGTRARPGQHSMSCNREVLKLFRRRDNGTGRTRTPPASAAAETGVVGSVGEGPTVIKFVCSACQRPGDDTSPVRSAYGAPCDRCGIITGFRVVERPATPPTPEQPPSGAVCGKPWVNVFVWEKCQRPPNHPPPCGPADVQTTSFELPGARDTAATPAEPPAPPVTQGSARERAHALIGNTMGTFIMVCTNGGAFHLAMCNRITAEIERADAALEEMERNKTAGWEFAAEGTIAINRLTAERDAAIARAEEAERARDEWKGKAINANREAWGAQRDLATARREVEATRAMLRDAFNEWARIRQRYTKAIDILGYFDNVWERPDIQSAIKDGGAG